MKKKITGCAVMYDGRFEALNMKNIELSRGFSITFGLSKNPKISHYG